MVRIPENTELLHLSLGYDPQKAHEYYLRTRKLHPRKKGAQPQPTPRNARPPGGAKAAQKRELQARITGLQKKLNELEALIRLKEAALKRSQASAKATAKKNSAAKKDKPKTAAEKAKAARDAKQYRHKHRQQLKVKAKQASNTSGGGSSSKSASKTGQHKASISELKALATKVRGQLAVAKQKLAAL